ncbi:16S rRNA (guanine(527)-N(7))-methyltransferase RsmG [uncultured Desulfosarcina sp.]|uniref:16S rRNA (guanine(527)-N(7))-methyltransferase RsmG n=1 Tax=uncultured Desulfosarcina sp. TaxID=218289 RepID=UPI0029C628FD|nr:16S rRNA (guanine(527)-N(7))-methyltransferase RsmG [uncultured Desulfosarcina sp.]
MEIDSEKWRQTVIEGALAFGLAVTDSQARTMGGHALELLQWNRVTNLTTITDPLEVAIKHYVDALAATPWIGDGLRVLDAGSGGGFPGIPLNIVRPDLTVTLVDSVRKKISFLKHAIRSLGLKGIAAVHGRLEDLCRQPGYSGKYDLVVCRAFSSLEDFAQTALPFLSQGGSLLAMKGPQTDPTHEAVNLRNDGTIILSGISFSIQIHRYHLPVLNAQRSVVILTPRKGGMRSEDRNTPSIDK